MSNLTNQIVSELETNPQSPVMGMMVNAKTDAQTAARVKETLNAHLVRWGFNPTLRSKPVDSLQCRFSIVPYAEWFIIHSFNTVREIHSMDEYDKRRGEIVTVSAAQSERYLLNALAGRDLGISQKISDKPDWGFTVGFHGEEDTVKMRTISAILMPPLSYIRALCFERGWKLPIADVCPGTDEEDSEARESCPTCWQQWLKSDTLTEYIKECAARGYTAMVDNEPTIIWCEKGELEAARKLMLDGVKRGIASMNAQWAKIVQEYNYRPERGGRKNISTVEHLMRKDIHKDRPEDKETAMLRALSQAGTANGSGDNPTLTMAVAQISEILKNMVDQQAKQSQANLPQTVSDDRAEAVGAPAEANASPAIPVDIMNFLNEFDGDGVSEAAKPSPRKKVARRKTKRTKK